MSHNSSLTKKQAKLCRVLSKKSGKVLSISKDPETKGVAVLNQNSSNAQGLFLVSSQKSFLKFQSFLTAQYLTIFCGSKQPGTMVVTLPDFGDISQRFILRPAGLENEYFIQTFCGLVLDCCQEGVQKGTRIIQWYQAGKSHQIWRIQFL